MALNDPLARASISSDAFSLHIMGSQGTVSWIFAEPLEMTAKKNTDRGK
jgi:hypothetical protein